MDCIFVWSRLTWVSLFLSLHQPSGVLPCSSALIITAVLSLLRICSGVSSSSSTGCSEVCRNVIGSGKVQKCALEALTALSSSPGKTVYVWDDWNSEQDFLFFLNLFYFSLMGNVIGKTATVPTELNGASQYNSKIVQNIVSHFLCTERPSQIKLYTMYWHKNKCYSVLTWYVLFSVRRCFLRMKNLACILQHVCFRSKGEDQWSVHSSDTISEQSWFWPNCKLFLSMHTLIQLSLFVFCHWLSR